MKENIKKIIAIKLINIAYKIMPKCKFKTKMGMFIIYNVNEL